MSMFDPVGLSLSRSCGGSPQGVARGRTAGIQRLNSAPIRRRECSRFAENSPATHACVAARRLATVGGAKLWSASELRAGFPALRRTTGRPLTPKPRTGGASRGSTALALKPDASKAETRSRRLEAPVRFEFDLHALFSTRGLNTTSATPHKIVRLPITVHCVSCSRPIHVPSVSAIAGVMYAIIDKR